MSLGAISQQFQQQVETLTGLPVHVDADERLPPPLLTNVQIAHRDAPLHPAAYDPSARAMADYLIAFQRSFVLRLHSMPPSEGSALADAQGTQPDPVDWMRILAASAHLPPGCHGSFADPRFNGFRKDTDIFHGSCIPPNVQAPRAQNFSKPENTNFKTAA